MGPHLAQHQKESIEMKDMGTNFDGTITVEMLANSGIEAGQTVRVKTSSDASQVGVIRFVDTTYVDDDGEDRAQWLVGIDVIGSTWGDLSVNFLEYATNDTVDFFPIGRDEYEYEANRMVETYRKRINDAKLEASNREDRLFATIEKIMNLTATKEEAK